MKKERKKRFSQMSAWLLSVMMVLSLVLIPEGTVRAEEIALSVPSATGTNVAISGTSLDVDITLPAAYDTQAELVAAGVSKIQVVCKVTSFTPQGDAGIQLFAMASGWVSKWQDLSVGTRDYTVELPVSSIPAGTAITRLGVQFTNVTGTISYEVISAKLIVEAGGSSQPGGGTGSDPGTSLEGVSVTLHSLAGSNENWKEYNFTIANNSSAEISNVQIQIPYSGNVNDLQSWGISARKNDGFITIAFAGPLASGQSFTCTSDQKFGFGGGGTLGTPGVVQGSASESGVSSTTVTYPMTGSVQALEYSETPVGKHGKLSLREVEGYSAPIIVDEHGNPFQLRGASTHGMHWNEMKPYVNEDSFHSLRDEWGVNLVRLVSYVTQGGYTEGSQASLDESIQTGVAAATSLGMYAIVDWHIHAENPWTKVSEAETFFRKYAQMYKDNNNVIYEICNEPTEVVWYNGSGADLYSYAKKIAGVIREYDPDALIICGTNTWSQDVDDVASKPLKDDGFTNILYTFHFYSGSHYDDKMNKVRTATAAGTPIFVTEFGICDASGNGGYDTANADAWIELCDANNISYACWSLCNKNESASYLLPGCNKTNGGWVPADLSTTGIWLVNTYRKHQDMENNEDTSIPGTGGNTSGGNTSGGNTSGGNTSGGNAGGGDSSGGNGNGTTGGADSSGGAGGNAGGNSGNTTGGNPSGGAAGGNGSNSGNGSNGASGNPAMGEVTEQEATVILSAPVNGIATKATKRSVTIKWKKKSNVAGYEVQISKKKNFKKATKYKVKRTATKKVIKKYRGKALQPGTKYYVRVRAYVKVNGVKKYGKWKTVTRRTK